MNRRLQRLNGLFQEELADLTRELRDPRLASIVSITRVDVSPDLEKAVVHVSVLGTDDEKRDSIAALSHAAPFLRRELLGRVRIRKVPALNFLLDETIEEAAHVLELMRQVIPAQPAPTPKRADD
jgi:ribosome-binding factor A